MKDLEWIAEVSISDNWAGEDHSIQGHQTRLLVLSPVVFSGRSAFASPGCWVAPQQAQASPSIFSRHLEPMAVSLHCFSSLHWDPSLNHHCLCFLAHSALGAEQLLMRWRLFKIWFPVEMCMTMSWDSWVAEMERTAPGSLLGLNGVSISDSGGVASSLLESVSSEEWLKELLMKILTSQTYWIKNSRVGLGSFPSFYSLLLLHSHSMGMEVRGRLCEVSFFLSPLRGIQEGCNLMMWRAGLFLSRPSPARLVLHPK